MGGLGDAAGVEVDFEAAGDGEEGFVGGDAEAIYLAVGVGDLAAAEAGEGFPEAVGREARQQ